MVDVINEFHKRLGGKDKKMRNYNSITILYMPQIQSKVSQSKKVYRCDALYIEFQFLKTKTYVLSGSKLLESLQNYGVLSSFLVKFHDLLSTETE